MQRRALLPLALPFFVIAASCAAPQAAAPGASTTASSATANAADAALDRLLTESWDATMAADPLRASELGDRRWNDRLPDYGMPAVEREQRRAASELRRARAIPRGALSSDERRLDYDLFVRDREEEVDGAPFLLDRRMPTQFALLPINQRDGLQTLSDHAELLRFDTVKDYEDWIARLRAIPTLTDQTIALMREGMRRRVVHPRVVMERVPAQIDRQTVTGEASPFLKPFAAMPSAISAADRARLTKQAKEAVEREVAPSYRKLKTFFVDEYLPACFDQVGAWQLPNGGAFYAYNARLYTTTRMTPKEIHEIGLREVARIRGEMLAIMAQVGFKGTLKEFFATLRTDPRFFYKTPEALLDAYRAMTKRIDPKLVRLFKTLPRTPYGVEPIPAAAAPDTTTAYYQQPAEDGSRAGTYYVNLYKPEVRPSWEMMALSLHESVPGHHLQIAIAQEHGAQPAFRRNAGFSAFVEGWGLYAESLGAEVGLYEDPYSKFGQLTYEMWRAVRLVVDTGMHEMKWTRQHAIDYFLENAAKQELDVTNEVDRYIAWPGQALAYKLGELKIKELRARAQKALGASFDVRLFHDVVLEEGAVPLDVLETHVDAWIAKSRAGATR